MSYFWLFLYVSTCSLLISEIAESLILRHSSIYSKGSGGRGVQLQMKDLSFNNDKIGILFDIDGTLSDSFQLVR